MDDIRLPMVSGSMDDISQEGAGGESQESEMDSMSTQGQKKIYEREANIQIDYDNLDDDLKDVSSFFNQSGICGNIQQIKIKSFSV